MNAFVASFIHQGLDQGENGRFSILTQSAPYPHRHHWGLSAAESERLSFVGRGVIWNWFSDQPTSADCFWARFVADYEQHGINFLSKLDGQFGFALFDKQTETLYAFRDPLGYYPLYLLQEGGKTAVSSHFKPLCQLKQHRNISPEAALFLMQAGFLIAGPTLVEGIEKLLPGQYAEVRADGSITKHHYWQWPSFEPEDRPEAAFIEASRAMVNEAVDRNLDGHKNVGLFLSGGLDSSILAGMLAQRPHIKTVAHNFGLNITHQKVDYLRDAPYAKLVAEHHQLDYREHRLDRNFPILDALQTVLPHLDTPVMSPNAVTKSYMVAEAAKHGTTAVFTGSAAFMPFANVENYHERVKKGAKNAIENSLLKVARTRTHAMAQQLFPDFSHLSQQDILAIMTPYFAVGPTRNDIEHYELGGISLYLTEKTIAVHHLVGDHHGVAAKMPFFDQRLAQFHATIPRALRGGDDYPAKYLLIKAFEHLLPPSIITRPQVGFPSYHWHRGELEQVQAWLFSDEVLRHLPFISPTGLRQLVADEQKSTRKSKGKLTWGIMVFIMWYLHFVLEWELEDVLLSLA